MAGLFYLYSSAQQMQKERRPLLAGKSWLSCNLNYITFKISGSFERLKDIAMKDLAMSLSSTKLRELTEFALHIENNTECNRKICIGMNTLTWIYLS